MRRNVLTILVVGVLGAFLLGANSTAPISRNSPVFARVGGSFWGQLVSIPTAGTEVVVVDESSNPQMFDWDTGVSIQATDELIGCWSLAPLSDVDISVTTGLVTDANGDDGIGNCFLVPGSRVQFDQKPQRGMFGWPGAILNRTGICSTESRPCRVDGDCVSGTCATSPAKDPSAFTGAYLILVSATDTNSAFVRIDK